MLQLKNIVKDYVSGSNVTHALKGVSVNFRRNEFVAILGASGCGKTTLLNITGGLDRYTSGDLVIEGKSTKEYKDRDWDTYRNHSIGFIFQSYNLIMHRNVISNVELALTISGVSREERIERAKKALKIVGLEGLEKKKPNQLSGGQMQRVAIARALINNPEILLADEPTGALDSETSVQIMELLKEVAKDRLVVMVTHNPDLAYEYANRIVKMKDGLIIDDSNPYNGETASEREINTKKLESKGNKKKTSMSFLTAGGLSMTNLVSKLKRTILVSFAGSIGIMGVSAVLAVRTGVNRYVDGMQQDMLSSYPVSISESSVDYTSLMAGLSGWNSKDVPIDLNDEVGVDSMINYLMDKYTDFTSVKTNDINQDLLGFIANIPDNLVSSINYNFGIDMTNNVFTEWTRKEGEASKMISLNGLTQMYISELNTVEGFSQYASFVSLFTNFLKQLPASEDYINTQYDCIEGRFPTNENEIMVVVDSDTTLTDVVFAQMGYFSQDQFLNLATKAIKENDPETDPAELEQYDYPEKFPYSEIIGKKLTYYPNNKLWRNGTFYSDYVDVLSATLLLEDEEYTVEGLYNITYDKITFSITEPTTIKLEFTRVGDKPTTGEVMVGEWTCPYGTLNITGGDPAGELTLKFGINEIPVTLKSFTRTETNQHRVLEGFHYPAVATSDSNFGEGTEMKVVGIYRQKEGKNFGCLSRGVYYTPALTKRFIKDSQNAAITEEIKHNMCDLSSATKFNAYVSYNYTSFAKPYDKTGDDGNNFWFASAINTDFVSSVSSLMTSTLYSNLDTDKASLRALTGLAAILKTDENGTPYCTDEFPALPQAIEFYPDSFEAKNNLTSYLDKWNSSEDLKFSYYADKLGNIVKDNPNDSSYKKFNRVLKVEDRTELTYSDPIELIITLIKTLIDAISIALIVFTSLSLIVSCFMIAVITYISTMERVKEIGVIRSLGGRKMDVSRLFISECFVLGLASGLIGITFTGIICLIVNAIVAPLGVARIAILTFGTGLLMVCLSILLNILSGLIPSMSASKQDPVVALRTE